MAQAKKTQNETTKTVKLNLALAVAWLVVAYGFASWAIDSGSLWVYAFTFASLYFFGHYTRLFIIGQFFNNGKKPEASKARKSTKKR